MATVETARVTLSDSARSGNHNRNPEYDLCKFYLTNRVVNTWKCIRTQFNSFGTHCPETCVTRHILLLFLDDH